MCVIFTPLFPAPSGQNIGRILFCIFHQAPWGDILYSLANTFKTSPDAALVLSNNFFLPKWDSTGFFFLSWSLCPLGHCHLNKGLLHVRCGRRGNWNPFTKEYYPFGSRVNFMYISNKVFPKCQPPLSQKL